MVALLVAAASLTACSDRHPAATGLTGSELVEAVVADPTILNTDDDLANAGFDPDDRPADHQRPSREALADAFDRGLGHDLYILRLAIIPAVTAALLVLGDGDPDIIRTKNENETWWIGQLHRSLDRGMGAASTYQPQTGLDPDQVTDIITTGLLPRIAEAFDLSPQDLPVDQIVDAIIAIDGDDPRLEFV